VLAAGGGTVRPAGFVVPAVRDRAHERARRKIRGPGWQSIHLDGLLRQSHLRERGGTKRARFICLHAGYSKGAVFIYAMPE
jgi:hypothetical protein